MENNYYVYGHIRKDNGKLFYIGKGRGKRAYDLFRNKDWFNVIKETEYEVRILCDGLSNDRAFRIERAYIKQFGLKNLVNKVVGGAGGSTHTEETRAKISASHKGRKLSEEHKAKISKAMKSKRTL
jgi:hypothetical protein